MMAARPISLPAGPVLVLAPHYDDEILGCGACLAGLKDKSAVRVAVACDGRGTPGLHPDSTVPGAPDIGAVRAAESRAALAVLGIPASAVEDLRFPDGSLTAQRAELRLALERLVEETRPAAVFAPFRFDRHPDHIALSRAALDLPAVREGRTALFEYFVYTRFRLFPKGDIRNVVRRDCLLGGEPGEAAFLKRRALDCFVTQTTRYFSWQMRPVLTERLVRDGSAGPELFLVAPPGAPDRTVLAWPVWAVRSIVSLEFTLKRAAFALRQGMPRERKP